MTATKAAATAEIGPRVTIIHTIPVGGDMAEINAADLIASVKRITRLSVRSAKYDPATGRLAIVADATLRDDV